MTSAMVAVIAWFLARSEWWTKSTRWEPLLSAHSATTGNGKGSCPPAPKLAQHNQLSSGGYMNCVRRQDCASSNYKNAGTTTHESMTQKRQAWAARTPCL